MNLHFILVEPAMPGNIGSSARAIKTMGFNSLRLVNPCDHQDKEAKIFAHGSGDILMRSKIFSSLQEAIEDIDFVIGTTSKVRSIREDYIECHHLPGLIQAKGNTIHSVGLVFGREESGLTNAELNFCDLTTTIPMANNYPSLNLAQAVMIYAYILSGMEKEDVKMDIDIDVQGLKELKRKVILLLDDLGLSSNQTLFNRILERLMFLEEADIHLLHSVLNKLVK